MKTQLAASLADDSPEGLSLPQQKALQILKQKGESCCSPSGSAWQE